MFTTLTTLSKNITATKTLVKSPHGGQTTIGYGQAKRFYGHTYDPQSLVGLSEILTANLNNYNTFAVRGVFCDNVDLSQPVRRLKHVDKATGDRPTLKEAPLPWVMFDIDKYPLEKLGIDTPLADCDISSILGTFIEKYAPELCDTSYFWQLSSSAGWVGTHTLSAHLFFWLDKPRTNFECKALVSVINAEQPHQIFDPALYNAAQPHYIANPILGAGVDHDPMPIRMGMVKKGNDVLTLPVYAVELPKPTQPVESSEQSHKLNQSQSKPTEKPCPIARTYERPKSWDEWMVFFKTVDATLHTIILDATNWHAFSKIWYNWGNFRFEVEKSLMASPRGKRDPARIKFLFESGEWDRACTGAIHQAYDWRWERFSSNLILGHTDTIKLDERYLDSIGIPTNDTSTLIIDSDLGTGKTQWFFSKIVTVESPLGKLIVALSPRRALSKATAERDKNGIMLDYEIVKAFDKKTKKIIDTRCIATCVNSLHQVVDSKIHQDVIFLDEIDLTIQHLYGGAIKDHERRSIIVNLLNTIANASHVIACQSLVTDATIDLLSMAGRKNIVKIANTYQPWSGLNVDMYESKNATLEVLADIASHSPFLCACNTATQAITNFLVIQKKFPEKSWLLATQDTANNPDVAAFLKNPNENAGEYDGIFYSPIMETGVSIDLEKFANVIGFCQGGEGVGTPEGFVQMLLRGRKAEKLTIWVDNKTYQMPETPEDCTNEAISRYNVANAVMTEKDGKSYATYEIDPIMKLGMKTLATQNRSKNQPAIVVHLLLTKRMGCNVNLIANWQTQNVENGKNIAEQGKIFATQDYKNRLTTALPLTPRDHTTLEKKMDTTQDEKWQQKRHVFERELCTDVDKNSEPETDALIKFWENGRAMHKIRGFEDGLLSPEHAYTIARHNLQTKEQWSESHGFLTRWIVRHGIFESLKIGLDPNGNLTHDPKHAFEYEDFHKTSWFKFACGNQDAINGSHLGKRTREHTPSSDVLGAWIRGCGVSLKSRQLKDDEICTQNSKQDCGDDVVTGGDLNLLKEIKSPPVTKNKRGLKRVYSVNVEKMKPLVEIVHQRRSSTANTSENFAERLLTNPDDCAVDEPISKVTPPQMRGPLQKERPVNFGDEILGQDFCEQNLDYDPDYDPYFEQDCAQFYDQDFVDTDADLANRLLFLLMIGLCEGHGEGIIPLAIKLDVTETDLVRVAKTLPDVVVYSEGVFDMVRLDPPSVSGHSGVIKCPDETAKKGLLYEWVCRKMGVASGDWMIFAKDKQLKIRHFVDALHYGLNEQCRGCEHLGGDYGCGRFDLLATVACEDDPNLVDWRVCPVKK